MQARYCVAGPHRCQ